MRKMKCYTSTNELKRMRKAVESTKQYAEPLTVPTWFDYHYSDVTSTAISEPEEVPYNRNGNIARYHDIVEKRIASKVYRNKCTDATNVIKAGKKEFTFYGNWIECPTDASRKLLVPIFCNIYDCAYIVVKSTIKGMMKVYTKRNGDTYNRTTSKTLELHKACYYGTDNPDIQDMLQECALSFTKSIMDGITEDYNDIKQAYTKAYKALNAYLYKLNRQPISGDEKTVCLEDVDGQIVQVNSIISYIITGNDAVPEYKYHDTRPEVNEFLCRLMEVITPTQKEVLKLLAYGYSVKQTAEKLHREVDTIYKHIKKIREHADFLNDIYKIYK